MRSTIAGFVFALALLASPASAQAALTEAQLATLLSMLTKFGESATTIQAIQAALGASAGTTGSLSFAPGTQPTAQEVKPGTESVSFTTVVITNNTKAAVTLYSLVVERGGTSTDANLKNLVLMQGTQALGNTVRSLDSRHQASLSANDLVLAAGQSVTLTVAADISTKKSRNRTVELAVVAVNSSSPIAGSLPLAGARHTIR